MCWWWLWWWQEISSNNPCIAGLVGFGHHPILRQNIRCMSSSWKSSLKKLMWLSKSWKEKNSESFCQVAELCKKVASDSEVYGMIHAHYTHEAHQQQIGGFQGIQWVVIAGFCSLMM
jgi:UDP-2,3-diacylglucosamine pyrophosphatase LpxH